MPVDGTYGRLSAHKQRTADLRRRKEKNGKLAKVFSKRDDRDFNFKEVSSEELREIKKQIQLKARLRKRVTIISMIIAIFIVLFFNNRYNIF